LDGVAVQLYAAGQTPGVGAPVAVATTGTVGGVAGVYRFGGLTPGSYVVHLPTPPAGAARSSGVTDTADNREDGDDNGIQTSVGGAVSSPVIALSAGEEDLTVDFGFVPDAPPAPANWSLVWQIGVDDNPAVSPYTPFAEFSSENGRNDAPPGLVTRLAGDPQYNATTNPGRDDDHYQAGSYPAGFNGLTSVLSVPNAEPNVAWERSLTWADRTNRVHFHLTAAQAAAPLRLSVEFAGGGWYSNGVVQAGFSAHEVVMRWRNGQGTSTLIGSHWITGPSNVVATLAAGSAGAAAGPNTLELARLGPGGGVSSQWVQFDYLRLESQTGAPGFARPASVTEDTSGGAPEAVPTVEVMAVSLLQNAEGPFVTLTYVCPTLDHDHEGVDLWFSRDLMTWQRTPYAVLATRDTTGLRFQTVRPEVSELSSGRLFFKVELSRADPKLPPR